MTSFADSVADWDNPWYIIGHAERFNGTNDGHGTSIRGNNGSGTSFWDAWQVLTVQLTMKPQDSPQIGLMLGREVWLSAEIIYGS
jgi:hypothetical protein